jgi:hypothetical protein
MQAEKKTPTPPPTTITTTMRTPAAIDDDLFMQEVCDDLIRKDCNDEELDDEEELDGGESDEGSEMGETVCVYKVESTRNSQDDNDSDPINNERWPDSDTHTAFAQSEDKDQCTPNQDDNNLDPIISWQCLCKS